MKIIGYYGTFLPIEDYSILRQTPPKTSSDLILKLFPLYTFIGFCRNQPILEDLLSVNYLDIISRSMQIWVKENKGDYQLSINSYFEEVYKLNKSLKSYNQALPKTLKILFERIDCHE